MHHNIPNSQFPQKLFQRPIPLIRQLYARGMLKLTKKLKSPGIHGYIAFEMSDIDVFLARSDTADAPMKRKKHSHSEEKKTKKQDKKQHAHARSQESIRNYKDSDEEDDNPDMDELSASENDDCELLFLVTLLLYFFEGLYVSCHCY